MFREHNDEEVRAAIRRLMGALCLRERATGRQSMLIIRENNGEMPGEQMTRSGFVLRADSGKPLSSNLDDVPDAHLLAPFTFAPAPAAEGREKDA